MTIRLIGLLLLGATLLAACGSAPQATGEPLSTEAVQDIDAPLETDAVQDTAQTVAFDQALYDRGIEVYLEAYCGTCHQLEAAETRGVFGPAHVSRDQLLEHLNDPNYTGSATTVEEYLRESILEPDVYFVPTYEGSNHKMPAFTHLSEADIDALVYMLANQG